MPSGRRHWLAAIGPWPHRVAHRHEGEEQRTSQADPTGPPHRGRLKDLRRPTDLQGHTHHGVDCARTTRGGAVVGRDHERMGRPGSGRGHRRGRRNESPEGVGKYRSGVTRRRILSPPGRIARRGSGARDGRRHRFPSASSVRIFGRRRGRSRTPRHCRLRRA